MPDWITPDELAETITAAIAQVTAPLAQRIAELENRPSVEDAGVYQDEQSYRKAHVVTHRGGLYIALRDAIKGVPPGEGTPESIRAWRLAVSRGKEGKQGPQGPPGRDAQ